MWERMEINGVEKLVLNLRNKKNHVIHIQALAQALQHGLRLDRIHQAIEFDQLPWLKTYIDFNTRLRTAATNDFEKDFFKLMNNSVFGKTMENIRKHRNINTMVCFEKNASDCKTFYSCSIFHNCLPFSLKFLVIIIFFLLPLS